MFYHDGTLFRLTRTLCVALSVSSPLFPLIYGCSSTPAPSPWSNPNPTAPSSPDAAEQTLLRTGEPARGQQGDFANRSNVDNFVQRMVQKHGFDGAELHRVLAQAERMTDHQADGRPGPYHQTAHRSDRRLESLPRQVHHPGQRTERRQLLA